MTLDIDSERMLIVIERAKGGWRRHALFSRILLALLWVWSITVLIVSTSSVPMAAVTVGANGFNQLLLGKKLCLVCTLKPAEP